MKRLSKKQEQYLGWFTLIFLALLALAVLPRSLLDVSSTNERVNCINGVCFTYQAQWGHSQFLCRTGGDVTHEDQSVPGKTILITGKAPSTGDRSCSTYNVGATYHFTFNPNTTERIDVHGTRTTSCTANLPYSDSSVNTLSQHQHQGGDGTATTTGGDISVYRTEGGVYVETTEGRSFTANNKDPLTITVTTAGGNKAPARMRGCDLTLSVTSVDVINRTKPVVTPLPSVYDPPRTGIPTPVPSTTQPGIPPQTQVGWFASLWQHIVTFIKEAFT